MWELIWREDTWGHMTGSFFGVWVFYQITYRRVKNRTSERYVRRVASSAAALCVLVVCIGVEHYQAVTRPEWFIWAGTIKDMVMNAVGITLAVLAIRRS